MSQIIDFCDGEKHMHLHLKVYYPYERERKKSIFFMRLKKLRRTRFDVFFFVLLFGDDGQQRPKSKNKCLAENSAIQFHTNVARVTNNKRNKLNSVKTLKCAAHANLIAKIQYYEKTSIWQVYMYTFSNDIVFHFQAFKLLIEFQRPFVIIFVGLRKFAYLNNK